MFIFKHNECMKCGHCHSFACSGDCKDDAHVRVMNKCTGAAVREEEYPLSNYEFIFSAFVCCIRLFDCRPSLLLHSRRLVSKSDRAPCVGFFVIHHA